MALPGPAAWNMTTSPVSELRSFFAGHATSQNYYGKKLGSFTTLAHGVTGDIYAVDSRTLHIRNLNYDGLGPGESAAKSWGREDDSQGSEIQERTRGVQVCSHGVTREMTQGLSAGWNETVLVHLAPSFQHELEKCSSRTEADILRTHG